MFDLALQALRCCSYEKKYGFIEKLDVLVKSSNFNATRLTPALKVLEPGRPCLPIHVHPSEVKRRRLGSVEGRVALIHAIAHIEFNAINLALDAIYRFADMPREYYQDWIRVAREESTHFQLLCQRLNDLSSSYGALTAHGGMWLMAVETDYDVMVRMALVPRVLEARGLDVTPVMLAKLKKVKDEKTVDVFERILREEVEHVKIGNHWFNTLCNQRSLSAQVTFKKLLYKHGRAALRGPFNKPARLAAGFSAQELAELEQIEQLFRLESSTETA